MPVHNICSFIEEHHFFHIPTHIPSHFFHIKKSFTNYKPNKPLWQFKEKYGKTI